MGVDLTVRYCAQTEDGLCINETVAMGRDSDWFDELQGDGIDRRYEIFLERTFRASHFEEYGYGTMGISYTNFVDWYELCQMDTDYGYITEQDIFLLNMDITPIDIFDKPEPGYYFQTWTVNNQLGQIYRKIVNEPMDWDNRYVYFEFDR